MIRLIDHKRIEMTNDEFNAYKQICRSYDEPTANRKGEDLFVDHFETNSQGIITFVKPPHQRYSSLEVYTFLISIMVNQHLRIHREMTVQMVKEAEEKLGPLVKELQDLKKELNQIKAKALVEHVD